MEGIFGCIARTQECLRKETLTLDLSPELVMFSWHCVKRLQRNHKEVWKKVAIC